MGIATMVFKIAASAVLLVALAHAQSDFDTDRCANLSDTTVWSRYHKNSDGTKGATVTLCEECNSGKYLQWLHADGGVCKDVPSMNMTAYRKAGTSKPVINLQQGEYPQNALFCAKSGWTLSDSSCSSGVASDCYDA